MNKPKIRNTRRLNIGGIAAVLLAVILLSVLTSCTGGEKRAVYIWWEAEDAAESTFPESSEFSVSTFNDKKDLLSGQDWISVSGKKGKGDLYARYEVEVPEDSSYHFWTRKFWKHGPFLWRFDSSGTWETCGPDIGLADSVGIRQFLSVNWVYLGQVELKKGKHSFELKLITGADTDLAAAFDCFQLTTGHFVPRGKLKPGEKAGTHEEGWWAFEPEPDPFRESPIDLRDLNEKEAGASGFVKRDGEKLVLGSGEPVRFWAVNAGPEVVKNEKASIDYLARRLAKYGVNMVRIHGSILDPNAFSLSKVGREYLDKLHYFVWAMKKQGIYVNLSFYFPLWIEMQPVYGIPGYDTLGGKYPFALLMIEEKLQGAYQTVAKELLLSKNPYTGISLAEDPAVAIVEVQNEDSFLFHTFSRENIPEIYMNKLEQAFGSWLEKKYGAVDKAVSTWGDEILLESDKPAEGKMTLLDVYNLTAEGHGKGAKRGRMSDQLRFLVETQKGFYSRMIDFYRKEAGLKCLISCSNWTTADPRILDALERYTYTPGDIIDRHAYFSAPHEGPAASYMLNAGDTYESRSALLEPESAVMQINQVEGYPHMTTETGWPNPNRFKAEGPALWAAYGSLQGVDAIHFFALNGVNWENDPAKFALMVPSVFGQFPGYALMYRRGDVQEAKAVVKVVHSLKDLYHFEGSPIYESQALDLLRSNGTR